MGKSPTRPGIDMAYVYGELDKGRTVESVAKELNISRRTLYRCHDMYQAQVPENEKRRGLTGGRGRKKIIDMDVVFEELSQGKSVAAVARELKVSEKTLYRHASKKV